jgi:PAS domain S-box-containing protein
MQTLAFSAEMTPINARGPTGAETWLLSLPPTRQQTRWAIAVAVCQVAALTLLAPFAKTRLAEINAFIPAFAGVTFVTNLVTSVLLFSQFAVYRLRAVLVLACGYLFSALMTIPYTLTFPGAFTPTGLLGASLQTTAFLYWFWHLLFPLSLLGYGLMKGEKSDPGPAQPSSGAVIGLSIALVLALVCGLTLLATAGNNHLPVLFTDRVDFTPAARMAAASTMLMSASAIAVLWLRQRSLLDQWLVIVALATVLEMALGSIFVGGRFSLGFYAGRLFSLLASTIVLVVLLTETTRLYANVIRSNEGKIRRLVDANILGICISNLKGAIFEANEAFLRMLQYSHEDVVSGRLRWTDLTPAEWREQDERSVAELRSTGAFHPVEKEYFRKDGSRVPMLVGGALFEKSGDEGVIFALDLTERKRAEEALGENERKLRRFFESVPCQFWSADPDGEPTYVNQRLLDYFGMRVEDQKFDDWQAVLHPDDVAETNKALYHAFRTGEPFQRVNRLRRADGEYRWHRTHAECRRDHKGNIIQWYGFNVDIDEGKKAEDALRRNEERLRRSEAYLAEAQIVSQTGSWAYSPVTEKILYWSAGCYRIWGFDPAHGLPDGLVAHRRIHPDDQDRVWEEAMEARRQKRDYTTEFRIAPPDGTVKYVEGVIHHVFSEEGELIELVGTNADVTERKRAEQALRESEAKFRAAIDGIAGLVAIMAPSGELEAVNRPIIEYFGRTVEELKNWGTSDAVHPEDLPRVLESYKTSLATGIPFHQEQRLRRFDGEYRWFENRGAPIRDESGRVTRWYCLLVDIDDRMRALERSQQLQSDLARMNRVSMMGELAASLTHEVTQPIASARNNACAALNFLNRQPSDLGAVREALDSVVSDADRAGNIIDRVRDQMKKAPPRKARFDLNEAIDEVIVLARTAIAKNEVSVQTRLTDDLLPVQGDRVQLQQVVLNLVLNAVEALGFVQAGGRELSIMTGQDQTGVRVAVRDSGPGIDPDHRERIFQTFYTTKPNGTGMGLSICRSIINGHGGQLWVEANEPRGAVFQFTLPGAEGKLDGNANTVTAAGARTDCPAGSDF